MNESVAKKPGKEKQMISMRGLLPSTQLYFLLGCYGLGPLAEKSGEEAFFGWRVSKNRHQPCLTSVIFLLNIYMTLFLH